MVVVTAGAGVVEVADAGVVVGLSLNMSHLGWFGRSRHISRPISQMSSIGVPRSDEAACATPLRRNSELPTEARSTEGVDPKETGEPAASPRNVHNSRTAKAKDCSAEACPHEVLPMSLEVTAGRTVNVLSSRKPEVPGA